MHRISYQEMSSYMGDYPILNGPEDYVFPSHLMKLII